jgi:hypothetical protein
MTKKHFFYFFFWKLWMKLNGIKTGTFFTVYSELKQKEILGVVTSLSGESINNKIFETDININWLEPIQGFDSRYHTFGSYSYKDTLKKLKKK